MLKRDRDLAGRQNEIWVRRGLFTLLCAVPLLALLNVFGQRPSGADAAVPGARLSVYAPARVRGGLLFEARFHIRAKDDLQKAILVLSPGWLEGMTVNTIEPAPVNEAFIDRVHRVVAIGIDTARLPHALRWVASRKSTVPVFEHNLPAGY